MYGFTLAPRLFAESGAAWNGADADATLTPCQNLCGCGNSARCQHSLLNAVHFEKSGFAADLQIEAAQKALAQLHLVGVGRFLPMRVSRIAINLPPHLPVAQRDGEPPEFVETVRGHLRRNAVNVAQG